MKNVLGHIFNLVSCATGTVVGGYGVYGWVMSHAGFMGPPAASLAEEFAAAALVATGVALFAAGYAHVFTPSRAKQTLHNIATRVGAMTTPKPAAQ